MVLIYFDTSRVKFCHNPNMNYENTTLHDHVKSSPIISDALLQYPIAVMMFISLLNNFKTSNLLSHSTQSGFEWLDQMPKKVTLGLDPGEAR